MPAFTVDRPDGRAGGDEWTADYDKLPGDANVSIIIESTTQEGVGPRLHKHPYAETFIIRRGSAMFTVGADRYEAFAGQILVVPADTPNRFSTGPVGYEAVHLHASPRS